MQLAVILKFINVEIMKVRKFAPALWASAGRVYARSLTSRYGLSRD